MNNQETVIEINGLSNFLGGNWVHKDLNLSIRRGEVYAVVGGRGTGNTTLLRTILMLQEPTKGDLDIFGINLL